MDTPQIDYSHIQNHFDAQLVGKEIRLEDKLDDDVIHTFNFPFKENETEKQFLRRFNDDFYCDWIRHTPNMVKIKDWFRKKYK